MPKLSDFDGVIDYTELEHAFEGDWENDEWRDSSLIGVAPNVKHVKIRDNFHSPAPQFSIFAVSKSTKLQTLEYAGMMYEDFDLKRVLKNYPSLRAFRSKNVTWEKQNQ